MTAYYFKRELIKDKEIKKEMYYEQKAFYLTAGTFHT